MIAHECPEPGCDLVVGTTTRSGVFTPCGRPARQLGEMAAPPECRGICLDLAGDDRPAPLVSLDVAEAFELPLHPRDDPDYITAASACRQLGLSRNVVPRWCTRGRVAGAKQADGATSTWWVPRAWLEQQLAEMGEEGA